MSKFSKKQVPLQLFPVLTSCPSYERLRARGFQPTSVHYFEEQKNRHHWTTNASIWRWWLRNSRHWKHRYKIDNDRRTYYTCFVNAALQDILLQDTLSREGHLAHVIIAITYGLQFGFLCHLRFVMCWTSNAGALPKKTKAGRSHEAVQEYSGLIWGQRMQAKEILRAVVDPTHPPWTICANLHISAHWATRYKIYKFGTGWAATWKYVEILQLDINMNLNAYYACIISDKHTHTHTLHTYTHTHVYIYIYI